MNVIVVKGDTVVKYFESYFQDLYFILSFFFFNYMS